MHDFHQLMSTSAREAERNILFDEQFLLSGRISRTIAHEIRNPLTNLYLALNQLRDEIQPGNDSAKLYCDIIERNTVRIEKLLGEILKSSMPQQLHLAPTDVCELINGALGQVINRIKVNEIKLSFTCQKDLPKILVDKEQIEVALLNVIYNAVEAMKPKHGILQISVSGESEILTIIISDNGSGIAAGELEKLFDPLYTKKHGGIRLGLTSAKSILNNHHAKVKVISELGKGTTFFISFTLQVIPTAFGA